DQVHVTDKDQVSNYVQQFVEKTKSKNILTGIKFNKFDESLLEKKNLLDPILLTPIAVPVRLNGNLYDYDSIIKCYHTNGMDPLNNIPFKLSNLSADYNDVATLEKVIAEIQQIHINQLNSANNDTQANTTKDEPTLSRSFRR